jgi:hypothetical protein
VIPGLLRFFVENSKRQRSWRTPPPPITTFSSKVESVSDVRESRFRLYLSDIGDAFGGMQLVVI